MRNDLRSPQEEARGSARKKAETNIVAAWACKDTVKPIESNAMRSTKLISLKVGTESLQIEVPIITNTTALKVGDEVVCIKAGLVEAGDEPASKRPKTETGGKGKSGGKGKTGKGAGKGRGKSKKL